MLRSPDVLQAAIILCDANCCQVQTNNRRFLLLGQYLHCYVNGWRLWPHWMDLGLFAVPLSGNCGWIAGLHGFQLFRLVP